MNNTLSAVVGMGDLREHGACDYAGVLNSLVKLYIFQIKKSLTHDQKKHHGREHS